METINVISFPNPSANTPQEQQQQALDYDDLGTFIAVAQVRYGSVGARILLTMLWPRPFSNGQLAYILNMPRQKVAGVIGHMIADGMLSKTQGDE